MHLQFDARTMPFRLNFRSGCLSTASLFKLFRPTTVNTNYKVRVRRIWTTFQLRTLKCNYCNANRRHSNLTNECACMHVCVCMGVRVYKPDMVMSAWAKGPG